MAIMATWVGRFMGHTKPITISASPPYASPLVALISAVFTSVVNVFQICLLIFVYILTLIFTNSQ